MKIGISKVGAALAVVFGLCAGYLIYLADFEGQGEAPIFIFLLIWPFSIISNELARFVQHSFGVSDIIRNNIELVSACALGVMEFYAIGLLAEKLVARIRKIVGKTRPTPRGTA